MVKLELRYQDLVLKEYTLEDGDGLTIGRHPDNDIVLNDTTVSRHHTSIERKGEKVIVFDKGSRNGTIVNGSKVKSAELYQDDTVRVGAKLSIKVSITSSKKKESTITGEHDNIR